MSTTGPTSSAIHTQPDPEATTSTGSYFPVAINALDSQELELDLYMTHPGAKPVLYRSVGSSYSMTDCAKLAEKGVTHLYVTTTQHGAFQKLMTDRLVRAFEDPSLERAERVRIVRSSCGKMIEDLMTFPEVDGIAETIGTMAARFSEWCTKDEDKFSHLLDMSEHDFYTATHMVNVGVGCGMLCAELLGPDSTMLQAVVQGGLVHDVGKRGVSTEVLNKEGKLTDEEWTQIRAHPQAGVEILSAQTGVNEVAIAMARDHHERLDGHGYPRGLPAADIGMPARICSVVDIYDALSSARPYRGAVPPMRVLDSLREEAGTVVDRDVFDAWERVVRRLIERDPSRCVADSADARTPSLRALIPSTPKQAISRDGPPGPKKSGGSSNPMDDTLRTCDVPASLTLVSRHDGVIAAARIIGIGPEVLRLETKASPRPGEVMRVVVDGRPPIDVVAGRRSFGPGGETIMDCSFVRTRKAG